MTRIISKRRYHFEDGRLVEDEPARLRCDCGHAMYLMAFTNTCEHCGTDYNMAGQKLAPRSQWGEETGESASDILSVGHYEG